MKTRCFCIGGVSIYKKTMILHFRGGPPYHIASVFAMENWQHFHGFSPLSYITIGTNIEFQHLPYIIIGNSVGSHGRESESRRAMTPTRDDDARRRRANNRHDPPPPVGDTHRDQISRSEGHPLTLIYIYIYSDKHPSMHMYIPIYRERDID